MASAEETPPQPEEKVASPEDGPSSADGRGVRSLLRKAKSKESVDLSQSQASIKTAKSGRSIRFEDSATTPARTESNISGSDVFGNNRLSSRASASSNVGPVRSVSQYVNAEGVSVDLAGRGLTGLSLKSEALLQQEPAPDVKPERPSGLLAVHSSRYEAMRYAPPPEKQQPKEVSIHHSGSRSYNQNRVSSRSSATSTRSSSRLSASDLSRSSRSSSMSRRSSSKRFFDEEGELDDKSTRDSQALRESRASSKRFSERLVSRQSSFKEAKVVKEELFGDNAVAVHQDRISKVERVDPNEVKLDLYQNELEFGEDGLPEVEQTPDTLFYDYKIVSERQRLQMLHWLAKRFNQTQLKELAQELKDLIDASPKVEPEKPLMDDGTHQNVESLIERSDRAIREKKSQQLSEIYEQRLKSVVEALVIQTHEKAQKDLAKTNVVDEKGKDLLDINKEDLHLRFYDRYETTISLGEGHLSRVLLCNVRNKPMELFAVKIVNKLLLSKQRLRYLRNELKLSMKLKHPCIVSTYDIYDHWDHAFLVMEYIPGGNLLEILRQEKFFDEQDAKKVIYDILRGVAFLHKSKIIHRDLKFDNVLCSDPELPFSIKIADFGLAHIVASEPDTPSRVPRTDNYEAYDVVKTEEEKRETGEEDVENGNGKRKEPGAVETEDDLMRDSDDDDGNGRILTSAVGTPAYAAPELLKGLAYNYAVDVWACGVMLFGMLSGSRPFTGNSPEGVLQSIERGPLEFPTKDWSEVSEQAKFLCRAMLEPNPDYRVTAEEAMRHTWFSDVNYITTGN